MKPTASFRSEPRSAAASMVMCGGQTAPLAAAASTEQARRGTDDSRGSTGPAPPGAGEPAPGAPAAQLNGKPRLRLDLSEAQEALIEDLETFIPRLRRYARSLSGDQSRADDLTQETLLRALDKLHQFQPGTNLLAWLFTIMRNTHLNGIRAAKFTKDADPHEIQIPTQGNQIDSLALRELAVAIDTLPDDQRETLMLIGVEGLAYQEVAEIMGVPIGTVRSRLSRARAALRPLLEGHLSVQKAEPA